MLKVEEEDGEMCWGGEVEPGSGQRIETVGEAGSGESKRGNVWVALTCQKFHHNFPHLLLLHLLYAQRKASRGRTQQHSSISGEFFKYLDLR